MGSYYDLVYSIQDGGFACVVEGSWCEAYDEDGNWMFDADENMLYDYYWNGQKVSMEEYNLQASSL
jgi:hypothetical protein